MRVKSRVLVQPIVLATLASLAVAFAIPRPAAAGYWKVSSYKYPFVSGQTAEGIAVNYADSVYVIGNQLSSDGLAYNVYELNPHDTKPKWAKVNATHGAAPFHDGGGLGVDAFDNVLMSDAVNIWDLTDHDRTVGARGPFSLTGNGGTFFFLDYSADYSRTEIQGGNGFFSWNPFPDPPQGALLQISSINGTNAHSAGRPWVVLEVYNSQRRAYEQRVSRWNSSTASWTSMPLPVYPQCASWVAAVQDTDPNQPGAFAASCEYAANGLGYKVYEWKDAWDQWRAVPNLYADQIGASYNNWGTGWVRVPAHAIDFNGKILTWTCVSGSAGGASDWCTP